MPENRIILQTPDKRYPHVRVTSDQNYLLLEHGVYKQSIFTAQKIETLHYNEHPELLDIWNWGAWDLHGLHQLLIDPDATDSVTIPLPTEFTQDDTWGEIFGSTGWSSNWGDL